MRRWRVINGAAFMAKIGLLGIGQILLQQRLAAGSFFLLAILWHSPILAAAALAGSLAGSGWAHWRRCSTQDVATGVYGFNAALIALAVAQVPRAAIWELILVMLGSLICIAAATSLVATLRRIGVPVYTAPFVIFVWIQLGVLVDIGLVPAFAAAGGTAEGGIHWADAILWSFGQVMFLNDSISGALILAGITLAWPRAALWALVAAVVATVMAAMLAWDAALISEGLFGYNAVLVAIALMGVPWGWRIIGLILSCLLMHGMLIAEWPALTAPFVLATWAVLLLRRLLLSRYNLRSSGSGRSRAE